MIDELREYKAVAGLLPTLLNRFEADVLSPWEKHGIRDSSEKNGPFVAALSSSILAPTSFARNQ
jgi:hypothetical protein